MKHTISVLVENKPGVLARIAGLFSARGFNIDSLAVGETEDPTVSRMTIIVHAQDARILEQILKQLRRLIDTINVIDLTKKEYAERELALVRVQCEPKDKAKVAHLAEKYDARILSTKKNSCVMEICADSTRVKEFLESAKEFGVQELARTGRVAISL